MADNSTQTGADTIRDKDRAGVKTQIFGLDLGIGTGTENLMAGSMPVTAAALTDGTQKTRITNGTVDSGVEPFGALQVNNGFQTLFYDAWDVSPIDTVDKWTVTGTTPTVANGNMSMVATASTYNAIRTKDAIRANVGFTLVRNGISIETATSTGAGRFWGLGTTATTPAAAVLAQDGIGFELDQATGSLLAVTYAAGVRTTVATLTRPTDGATHAYGCYFRVTQAYWVLDGVTVASLSFPNVQVAQLPALIVRQNASAFTGTPTFTNIAHLTADTSRQGQVIADPVIGTRMARVGTDGTLKVSGTGTAGVSATSVQTVQGIAGGTALPVSGTFFQATQPVSGTFFQATQPVTASTLPLPTGASTETTLAALNTKFAAAASAADAAANPTLTQVGVFQQLFNGSTWDRQRGMSVATTTGDTGAKTATGTGATQTNVGNKGASIFIILGAVSGTTPTCVFKVQGSTDGTNFFDIPGAATASLVASVNVGISVFPGVATVAGVATTGTTASASQVLPRFWRLAWTIGGTLPSFTITSVTYNYLPY